MRCSYHSKSPWWNLHPPWTFRAFWDDTWPWLSNWTGPKSKTLLYDPICKKQMLGLGISEHKHDLPSGSRSRVQCHWTVRVIQRCPCDTQHKRQAPNHTQKNGHSYAWSNSSISLVRWDDSHQTGTRVGRQPAYWHISIRCPDKPREEVPVTLQVIGTWNSSAYSKVYRTPKSIQQLNNAILTFKAQWTASLQWSDRI